MVAVNELLWYMCTVLQSSTKDKTKDAILSFYEVGEIAEAKNRLYDDFKETVGKPPSRRGSSRRSEEEADLNDIFEALDKLDKANISPEYYAKNGIRVPLILPEISGEHQTCAMNMKAIERRVAQLEMTISAQQTLPSKPLSYSEAAEFPPMPKSESHVVQFRSSANMTLNAREHAVKMNSLPMNRTAHAQQSHQSAPRNKREPMRRQDNIRNKGDIAIGTGGNQRIGGNGLRGAPPPKRDFFIYRVDKSETIERVSDHLNCLGVNVINVERTSHEEAKFASFRLTTSREYLDTIMNPDNWPEGIRVRPFYQKRTASYSNDNDNRDPFLEFRPREDIAIDRDMVSQEGEQEEDTNSSLE